MNREQLLAMAEDIKKDFDTIMPEGYNTGWRYNHLLEMMDELRTGQLKDHKDFDHWTSSITDELVPHRELFEKVGDFKEAFQKAYEENQT